jgi:transposase-like protein
MTKHRSHSIEFKRQVAQEYLAGETLHGLARRHDVSRNLIRIWVAKYEAGAFDDDARAVDLLQEYEARIAALERLSALLTISPRDRCREASMVGRQALELEFLKGASRSAARSRGAGTSVIAGPVVSPSLQDAG